MCRGVARRRDFLNEREALTTGQNPVAGILSCADHELRRNMLSMPAAAICSSAVSPAISSMTMGLRASNMPFRSTGNAAVDGPRPPSLRRRRCGGQVGRGRDDPAGPSAGARDGAHAGGKSGESSWQRPRHMIKQNALLNVERLKNATPIVSEFVADGKVRRLSAASTSSTRVRLRSCNSLRKRSGRGWPAVGPGHLCHGRLVAAEVSGDP